VGLFSFLGNIVGGGKAKKASRKAEAAQLEYLNKALAEQQRQFDVTRADYEPARSLLAPSVEGLGDLVGVNGVEAQQTGMDAIQNSPLLASIIRNGEESVLQNASATGGLRGGNVQGALAQFRPAMLNQQIQQQLANFQGIASLGQNAAVGTGNAGLQTGQNIAGFMQDSGQARAFGALGQGQALAGGLSALGGLAGTAFGGGFGGGAQSLPNNSFGGGFSNFNIPGGITGFGSGTFDSSGKQVTF